MALAEEAISIDSDTASEIEETVPAIAYKEHWSEDEPSAPQTSSVSKPQQKDVRASGKRKRTMKGYSTAGKQTTNPKSREKAWDDPISSSEEGEDAIDKKLPEYIKRRRIQAKNKRSNSDVFSGLKIPPSFQDVVDSDDEQEGNLSQKPDFIHIKPINEYKNIELPYSLGVIPAPIARWLRPYQVEGVSFLHELFVYQKGGILGDDMGLGKTIQVIAFLTAAFGKTGDERDAKRMRKIRRQMPDSWYPRVMIVCPGGLMENWRSELERWGWWDVDTFHGGHDAKDAALQAARSGRLEILITTYRTYTLNKQDLNTVEWDCVIADECHIIKERHSDTTKAMNEVNALCRIGLSGTAIQNKYEELWNLLNWTNPGRFGPLSSWRAVICQPLKDGQAHDATVPQLAKARQTARRLVHNLLPEFFLRRMKTLIASQLPKKSDRVVFCPLTPTQCEAYESFVSSDLVSTIRTSSDPCDCSSGRKRGWCCYTHLTTPSSSEPRKWQLHVFPAISTLQRLANHLALLIPSSSDSDDRQTKDLDVLQIALPTAWKSLYRKRDNIINFAEPDFCGKWRVLQKLLRFWHANSDKVLVFSHSVRLLKMLQLLFKATTTYNVSYLDGSMSYAERARAVDHFNADAAQFVFLISTRAGGVGLNITSANKVVVVDPNWNPAYDLQAQDRAYRIGQVRDVEVFRLVSAGTIEEVVYARQIYKQQQANIGYNASVERRYFTGVQENKEKKGEIFGLQNLLSFQGESLVLRDIVNKTNVAESKAGVNVVGLDLESGIEDEEDFFGEQSDHGDPTRAMNHLAELIAKGDGGDDGTAQGKRARPKRTRQKDAVQAILAGAGVEYTHENSEVIGSSKIETRLSRRAEEARGEMARGRDYVFAKSQSQQAEVSASAELGEHGAQRKITNAAGYKYHPPLDVRRRQFCTMAKMLGYDDVLEFALLVESWTQSRRRDALDRFYRELKGRGNGNELDDGNDHDENDDDDEKMEDWEF